MGCIWGDCCIGLGTRVEDTIGKGFRIVGPAVLGVELHKYFGGIVLINKSSEGLCASSSPEILYLITSALNPIDRTPYKTLALGPTPQIFTSFSGC